MRPASLFFALAMWLITIAAAAQQPRPPRVAVERAPEELGAITGKDVLIAALDRELHVYDPERKVVERFTEKGRAWGDPVRLRTDALQHRGKFIRMDVDGDRVVLAGYMHLAVFSADEGSLLSERNLFQLSDVALLPGGDVATSLTNVPHPVISGAFLARESFGDEVPRLLVYDDDGEVAATGLFEDMDVSLGDASRAMARSLRLSWGKDSLWAAELGSYRLLELDRQLKVLDEIHDPELEYSPAAARDTASDDRTSEAKEPGQPGKASPSSRAAAEAEAKIEAAGRDLTKTRESRKTPMKLEVQLSPVVVDLDWGPKPSQVYFLLDGESFRQHYMLDQLDPVMGEIRRSEIDLTGADGKLAQVATSVRYVWLRGYRESSPIYRVDRSLLNQGLLLEPLPP